MNFVRFLNWRLAGLAVLAFASAAGAEEPSKLVPENAAIYVEVAGLTRAVDRLMGPDVLGLLETVDQYREATRSTEFAQFRSVVTCLETKLGTTWRQAVGDLTHGGAAIALVQGQPDVALVIARAKDAGLLERLNQALMELADQDAKNKGQPSPFKSTEYKGVKAWGAGKQWFHAIVGDTFIYSNHQNGLKAVLDLRAGAGAKPIADHPRFREARGRAPAGAVAWGFVQIEPFRSGGFAEEFYAEKAPNAGVPFLFGGLGHALRTAPYLTLGAWVDDKRVAIRAEVPRDGKDWPEQFRPFYAATPGKEAAAALHPPRTIASFSFYRDLKGFWDAKDKLIVADGLSGFAEVESQLGQVLFGGRDFVTEVLSEFAPQTRIVVALQTYNGLPVVPEIKIPAFAVVQEIRHPEEFGKELLVAFQSFTGLANIGLAQQNQPRLFTQAESYKGLTITASRFLPPPKPKADDKEPAKKPAGPGSLVYNFSPATAQVGRYFVLGSTVEIVKDLIDELAGGKAEPPLTPHNVLLELETNHLVDVLKQNREPLVHQNMAAEGHTREQAEKDIDTLFRLLGLFGPGRATWTAEPAAMHVDLELRFAKTK
jgi:hypothetical protein